MINTGDWGVQELVKYLVAVRSSLTDLEMTKLKQTPAFPRENEKKADDAPVERCKPSELYEPTDALRDLKLPVLDWGTQHKWRAGSDEGLRFCSPCTRPLTDVSFSEVHEGAWSPSAPFPCNSHISSGRP